MWGGAEERAGRALRYGAISQRLGLPWRLGRRFAFVTCCLACLASASRSAQLPGCFNLYAPRPAAAVRRCVAASQPPAARSAARIPPRRKAASSSQPPAASSAQCCWLDPQPGMRRLSSLRSEVDHRVKSPIAFFSLSTRTSTQRYLQPPFVTMCVSRHCAPPIRFSYATVWGVYDMWMFRGSRSWSQWGVVRRFHVLLACRKFWFCYVVYSSLPRTSRQNLRA
jgi:hypothetical protein